MAWKQVTPEDEFDVPPDHADVKHMEAVTTAMEWPWTWLAPDKFMAELTAQHFWATAPSGNLATLSDDGRREWLGKVLGGALVVDQRGHMMGPIWEELDGRYMHHGLIRSVRDCQRLANKWTRKKNDAPDNDGPPDPLPFPDAED